MTDIDVGEPELERIFDGDFAIEDDDDEPIDPSYESPFKDEMEEDIEDEYSKDNREGWEGNIERWNDL